MKANKHSEWEGRVDGTWFGLMAGYLRSPRSPIDYLVHEGARDEGSVVGALRPVQGADRGLFEGQGA